MSQDCSGCSCPQQVAELEREIEDMRRQIDDAKRLCWAASDRWQQTAAQGNTPRARWAWIKGQGKLGKAVLARLP